MSSAAAFLESGYGVIPAFVEAEELGPLSACVESALAQPRHAGMSRPGNDLIPLRWNDAIVAHMLRSPRRLRRLAELLRAPDLKWLAGYVSTKPPRSGPLFWHQDWWCWDHPISFERPAAQVAVLCYLMDTDSRHGALRLLPGSHHASAPIHRLLPEPHGDTANALACNHAAMVDLPGQVTLSVRAGDAVVIDYRLLHGTHANEAATRRDCILLSFIPAWRRLPGEIKAHLIAHPALPDGSEARQRETCSYGNLLPMFAGPPASLPLNRVAPAQFAARA
ncbi:MAG TPA: phytanoyl-CoA dioxygenase family protein [Xanthobacteraceae bacterium]|nr:phytanoyl-CoA dioxygenase family protein [Xanthobacteraceae bacterium]